MSDIVTGGFTLGGTALGALLATAVQRSGRRQEQLVRDVRTVLQLVAAYEEWFVDRGVRLDIPRPDGTAARVALLALGDEGLIRTFNEYVGRMGWYVDHLAREDLRANVEAAQLERAHDAAEAARTTLLADLGELEERGRRPRRWLPWHRTGGPDHPAL